MSVVACSKCGTKNRVDPGRAFAQVAKCGKCGATLDLSKAEEKAVETKPLVVSDASFQRDVIESSERPVLLDAWRRGADPVAWSVQSWSSWPQSRKVVTG